MRNRDYPHLNDTEFPDLASVNVYKYENEIDYSIYKDSVTIKLLNVSWCGDYNNAVYFETKKQRDEWFDNEDGLVKELPTMFRLYSNGTLKVDLPIDECMDYNYCMIDYGKLPLQNNVSDNSRMFYFIDSMNQESPNATKLMLSVDYWTTFINDMKISYVNLIRGHAPMAENTVEEYLANPIENSEYMLTEDVNYGSIQRVASTHDVVLNYNEDAYLCFITNGTFKHGVDNTPDWEGRTMVARAIQNNQAFSATTNLCIKVENWDTFQTNVMEQRPQFFTTIKGIFIAPSSVLQMSPLSYTFCGVECWTLTTTSDNVANTFNINKEMFHFPENISEIPKLYTYPYSAIEVNDFKGNIMTVKVEDTNGYMEFHTLMNDMYPFVNVEGYINGVGGGTIHNISFYNTRDNTYNIGGRYYNFTTKWYIPVFALQLTNEAYWNVDRKINADANLEISYRNAKLARDIAALKITMNSANTDAANELLNNKTERNNAALLQHCFTANNIIDNTSTSEIAASERQAALSSNATTTMGGTNASLASTTGTINALGSVASGITSGVASGNPISGAASVLNGVVNGAVSVGNAAAQSEAITANANTQASLTMASMNVSNNLTGTLAFFNKSANLANRDIDYDVNNDIAGYEVDYNNTTTTNGNAFTNSNATASSSVAEQNADTGYDANYKQTLLMNPPMYGQLTGTQDLVNKPFGISYNIVTQSKNAIRQVAEQFLRYGYMLNMQWKVSDFNIMSKFTYWLCDVVYCNDNGVYEGAQDAIKQILNNGVTIWRDPHEIGVVSIYENEVI